jgi:hypothetical protein
MKTIIDKTKTYLARLFFVNKEFMLNQALAAKGFMQLLMKSRNTGEKWTKEEKKLLKQHLKTMALAIPALIVFLPPGGSIFLPLLVDLLDRRKSIRRPSVPKKEEIPLPDPLPLSITTDLR